MPRFILGDDEINYIASYLLSLKSHQSVPSRGVLQYAPTTRPISFYKHDIKNGENLINTLGCLGCHKLNNQGIDFAPDLSDIGNKVKPEWIYQFLKSPKSYDPKTIIPDFVISETEISAIAAYLMSLRKDRVPHLPAPTQSEEGPESDPLGQEQKTLNIANELPLSPGGRLIQPGSGGSVEEGSLTEDIEKGRKLVGDLGCKGCHTIEKFPFQYSAPELDGIGDKRVDELVFNSISDVEKNLINWLKTKVKNPERFATDKIITKMPTYDFNEKQAEALAVFLLSLRKDSLPRKYVKILLDPDGADMRGKKIFEKYNCLGCHLLNKEGGEIAPDLTDVGRKTRQEWLFAFLKDPEKIRPVQILKARMPNFNLSDKETSAIVEYLSYVSKEPYPYNVEPKKNIHAGEIWDGEKLYREIFACSACHIINGLGGEVGPDHTDLASRIKKEWLEQWLQNPQAIKPDVRMPRYKFKGWEFEALTNYLMTLGKYRFVHIKTAD
jgi:cytochrome c2